MFKRPCLALTLIAGLVAGGLHASPLIQTIDFVGNYTWKSGDKGFGGFSAIEILEDGEHFLALSDRSRLVQGRLIRDASGRITGVEAGMPMPLTMAGGALAKLDSEGLALAPDGTLWISEENRHRIAGSRTPGQGLEFLPPVPRGNDLIRNESFESLAVDGDGTLYTMAEFPREIWEYPVYRYRDGKWDIPFSIPRHGEGWAAVGSDFGPDGRFYLLEREFAKLSGFRSRIRAFTFGPNGPEGEETLLVTPFRQFGNLEGLSVWRDGQGHIRYTMIADDAFSRLFSTSIVEYRSRETIDLAKAAE